MGLIWGRPDERQPVKTCGGCLNALVNSWRGLISTLWLLFLSSYFSAKVKESPDNLIGIWLSMLVFMLFLPMPVGGSALMPVFWIPMVGILNSAAVCGALTNENIILYFLGGWLMLLVSNCGLDKRLVCCFLAKGDINSYTPNKLMLKSCMAAFCISAISERNLTTQAIMHYIVAALDPLKSNKKEVDFEGLKNVLCNAIAVSSFLGSLCILHASVNTIQMRALFSEATTASTELPDVFNFLNYSAYAIPVALVMFLLNTGYEIALVSKVAGSQPMSQKTKEQLQRTFRKNSQDLGPMSPHEKVSIFFLVIILLCFFTRWSKWLNMGWATFRQYPTALDLCAIKDATTAAIFVVLLHFLPKSLNFFKIWCVKKHGDLPKMQRESGILFWKYLDNNTDYSLFILLGAGSIIYKAMVTTNLHESIRYFVGDSITGLQWNVGILVVVVLSVVLGSLMAGVAAQACLMPLMLGIAMTAEPKWPQRQYLVALGVGVGTALGFVGGYQHSPSFYVQKVGKVGRKKQFMYSIPSEIICALILWLSLCFYAPLLWDPDDTGVFPQASPDSDEAVTSTEGPEAAPEGR